MTKITKMIYPKITRYGFCNKGNVVFRLSEDIVQGFEIKHKHVKGRTLYTVSFSTQPLCYPTAAFYKNFFEGGDIGWLMSPPSFWPFAEIKGEPFSFEHCVEDIGHAIIKWLLPYYGKYHNCKCISEDISALNGFNKLSLEAAYVHLKAGNRDAAISGIRNLQHQRKEAAERNAQYGVFPAESPFQAAVDEELRNLYEFFSSAPEKEIKECLLANERRATDFLQGVSNS